MTEAKSLETLLAEALDYPDSELAKQEAAAILATPAGQRLQAVYDAAVAWRMARPDSAEDAETHDNLRDAVDVVRGWVIHG